MAGTLHRGAPRVPPGANSLAFAFAEMSRPQIEDIIEAGIAHLDALDGDPEDQQLDGDELDGSSGEDDWPGQGWDAFAPGCPIADPGGAEHDGREEEYPIVPTFGLDQSLGPVTLSMADGHTFSAGEGK